MPGFLDGINPNGRVPVLETDDGTFLAESGTILFTWPTARPSFPTIFGRNLHILQNGRA
jgi:hypothetical protein